MEKEVTRQDKIDAYILNQMSSSERNDFESQMKSDRELDELVRFQKMIVEEISDRESFQSLLEKHKQGKIVKLKVWRILSVAAVFTGLLGFFILQPTRTSNELILNSYSLSFPDKIQKNKFQEPLRGQEYYIPYLSENNSENAIAGLSYFERKDFQAALESFGRIDNLSKHPDLLLYMSISQMKLNQNEIAIRNLEYLVSIKDFKYSEPAYYYLSLGYIQKGKILKAREILKRLVKNNGEYSAVAVEILSKLRWF